MISFDELDDICPGVRLIPVQRGIPHSTIRLGFAGIMNDTGDTNGQQNKTGLGFHDFD